MATELFCTVSRPADTDYATLPSLFSTSLAEWMGYRRKKTKKGKKQKREKNQREKMSLFHCDKTSSKASFFLCIIPICLPLLYISFF